MYVNSPIYITGNYALRQALPLGIQPDLTTVVIRVHFSTLPTDNTTTCLGASTACVQCLPVSAHQHTTASAAADLVLVRLQPVFMCTMEMVEDAGFELSCAWEDTLVTGQ
ncbi:unnamed protein product [Caretta caretta]